MAKSKNLDNVVATVTLCNSINDIPEAEWDICVGAEYPFLLHAFMSALEDSGSVSPKTGWLPQHLVYRDSSGKLVGAVPLYLKGHSYGEYVFDWGWADAFEKAGQKYFPKLLSAVPFTPVTCPKLLVRPGENQSEVRSILTSGLVSALEQLNVSSLHINFSSQGEWEFLGKAKFLKRQGIQYHWNNNGYSSFDDFLNSLTSRKRKAIRKERKAANESGVKIRSLTGAEIEKRHWDAFFQFYVDTTDRKWGSAYLNRDFFTLLGERMADKVLLIIAEYDTRLVGGALNFIGKDTLFGRNWGCLADFKFLHFEACYYRAIDFAIEKGLSRVEAGAQGEHKIQRGYIPTLTYSNHYIDDLGFRDAVAQFLRRESAYIVEQKTYLDQTTPFRQEQ
ncbi:GNAT family N-acetyltransferase [Alphaproteobacteria bacterium]|jgi:predicted N-acyltransferase|nr:GNAT family N-acetyltransferase [Alphaproteobacteria bacterium]|tara:strand:+ start:1547 stop:2719 length:1173 start_codon:yes stop_codon:yes gene_type:complete